jgi:small nuclear ribonucleoprotein (snRNP)-like protein
MERLSPVIEELNKYIGKYVKVGIRDKGIQEYEGILKKVYLSKHNGIGNLLLEKNRKDYLIIGNCIVYIILPDTIYDNL